VSLDERDLRAREEGHARDEKNGTAGKGKHSTDASVRSRGKRKRREGRSERDASGGEREREEDPALGRLRGERALPRPAARRCCLPNAHEDSPERARWHEEASMPDRWDVNGRRVPPLSLLAFAGSADRNLRRAVLHS